VEGRRSSGSCSSGVGGVGGGGSVASPPEHVLINVMHTMRLPVHSDIGRVFGNFSSTSLLDATVTQSMPFRANAAATANQLASDLEHWR
jgi:hypothetical protein